MNPSNQRILTFQHAALCFALVVVAAMAWRLPYGISFWDESFYVALPYRYVLGDQIFKDDLMLAQTFSLISLPFVRGYHALFGVTGLMLFMRVLSLLFSISVAGVLYFLLRKRLGKNYALLFALVPIAFVPFSIANLSYNTWAIGFWTAGVFLGWSALQSKSKASWLALLAGLAQGISVIAHPSFVPGVGTYALFFLLLTWRRNKSLFLAYVLGGALTAAWLFTQVSLSDLERAKEFSFSENNNRLAWPKLFSLVRDFYYWGPSKPWVFFLSLLTFATARYRPSAAAILLCFTPLLCWVAPVQTSLGALQISLYFALLGPFFFVFTAQTAVARHLFFLVWIPSLAAGIATGMSSTNHTTMAGLGMLPAALVSLFLLYLIQSRLIKEAGRPSLGWIRATAPVLLVLLFLSHFLLMVYGDGSVPTLTAKMKTGVYSGLYTTPARARFLGELSADLSTLENAGSHILFYDAFPAGYLMTSMRPATPTVWNCIQFSQTERNQCLRYYQGKLAGSNVVVKMKHEPTEDRELDSFVQRYHQEVRNREDYSIYSLKKEINQIDEDRRG